MTKPLVTVAQMYHIEEILSNYIKQSAIEFDSMINNLKASYATKYFIDTVALKSHKKLFKHDLKLSEEAMQRVKEVYTYEYIKRIVQEQMFED